MAQDSNAPDRPANSKDQEALAEIARQIATSGQDDAVGSPNGAELTSMEDAASAGERQGQPAATECSAVDADMLAGFLQCLPGGIAFCDGNRIARANDAFALAFGYRSGSELMAAGGIDAIFPELRKDADRLRNAARGDAALHTVTLQGCSRSGRRFSLPVAVHRPTEPDGSLLLLVLHPEVGTPRASEPPAEAPAPAARAETLFRLADGISDGLLLLSADGAVAAASGGAADLLGVAEAPSRAIAFRDLVSAPDRPALDEVLAGLAADRDGPAGAELEVTLAGDAEPGRKLRLSLVRTASPGLEGVLAMLRRGRSLPEPPPAEPEAPENKPESAAMPAEFDFLAKVSHEVRTPLNSIIGFAEIMRDQRFGPIGNARYRGYVNDIYESGVYALSLINDLLDISKLEAGKFELNFAAVDPNEVIAECVHLMQPQARHGRVVLRLSLADTLPRLLADRRSLKQILLNLISNAIKFTDAGGQVVVSSRLDEDGQVRLAVRDSGIGMSDDEIAQAMKPFEQLDTVPRTQIGTGLGLPLTKALVEASRAEFRLQSASGSGTRAEVVFPADRQADGTA